MRRTFVECFQVTALRGEQRKFSKGGQENGPAVQLFETCAEISAVRVAVVVGESNADFRFVHDSEVVLSPVKPRFTPCRIMWIMEDTKFWLG